MKPLLVILLLNALSGWTWARTWTSSDGRTLEADFVSSIGGTVTLKRAADGKTFTLPLLKLSPPDQEWVKIEAAAPKAGANTATKPAAIAPATPAPAATGPTKPIEGPFAKLITGDWALSEEGNLPFALYASKDINAGQKYPLVLALHGKSQNNENGKQVGGWIKSFAKPENYAARPCVIVAPLCYQPFGGTGGGWYDKPGTEAVALVKKLVKALPIDDKRIYVVGHSMGGFGTCHLMNAEPRLFTAGIAVSGCTGVDTADTFKRRPLWLFHAADDATVEVKFSRDLAKACERSKVFKYTEYPSGGHGIPGKVFDTPEVQTWLFSQVEK
jgi:predicted peptidase